MPDAMLQRFAARLADLDRDNRRLVDNLFCSAQIESTTTRDVRAHVLRADSNGRPMLGTLVRELASMVLDYCIPRSQATEALEERFDRGSYRKLNALMNEARSMFSDLQKSGEGGELLLFLLTESLLDYKQAVAKMALKTSATMHFHGLDGIYISCNGAGLRLHYGESKVHKEASASVREAVASIAPLLKDEGRASHGRRDAYLLNTQVDLDDPDLRNALIGFLDPSSDTYQAPEVCAVLLAGFNYSKYPVVRLGEPLPDSVVKSLKSKMALFSDEAQKQGVDNYRFDAFLVPFKDVDDFRGKLLVELGLKDSGP